jgi:hypothetical protein
MRTFTPLACLPPLPVLTSTAKSPIEKKKDEGSTTTVSVPDWHFIRDYLLREGKITKAQA